MQWRSFLIKPMYLILLASLTGCQSDLPASQPIQEVILLTPFVTETPDVTSQASTSTPTSIIITPTQTPIIYTIQPDELVSAIAYRFGVTLAQIQAANPGVDLNFPPKNQQLIIPSPIQTPNPEQGIPTPVPLPIENVDCFPAADGGGICMGVIVNDQSTAVMYMTGEFILEGNGTTLQAPFTALVDTLPPDARIPVYALFPAPFPYPYHVNLILRTALAGSSQHLEIVDRSVVYSADGLSAHVTGHVNPGDSNPKNLAIIAAGYSGGRPAGVRRLEIADPLSIGQTIPFDLWVYSVGPLMDQVELFVESF